MYPFENEISKLTNYRKQYLYVLYLHFQEVSK